ncbi:hypothetical protein GCM10027293_11480 [Pontibacter aydingkolensis]
MFESNYFELNPNYEFIKSDNLNVNLIILSLKTTTLICKTSLDKSSFDKSKEHVIAFNIGLKYKLNYNYNGTTLDTNIRNLFTNTLCNTTTIEKLTNTISDGNYVIDKEGFWFLEREREQEYLKTNSLQVHHKCYRKNIEIWAQDDSEYETLCNVCHRIVHENQKIPFYDSSGNLFSELIPCSRCGGQKYFKCYSHINGGACFKCGGYGFENKAFG